MKLIVIFLTLALVCASAATYNVTLMQPSTFAGKELKAGDYKLSVESDKAILTMGKEKVAEATVKVETNATKFTATSVRCIQDGSKMKVQEIRLGGTTTKVVFN